MTPLTTTLTTTAQTATVTIQATITGTITATLTPVPTNPGLPSAGYGNISFYYSPSLANSVTGKTVPANTNRDFPNLSTPEMIVFDFSGYPVESSTSPVVQIFAVEAYRELSAEAAAEITGLQALLRDKTPAPANLPLMPLQPVGTVLNVQIGYLDFHTGSGVRYLTQMTGAAKAAVRNGALFYTFQGITGDERYYIAVTMPVFNPILTNPPDPTSLEANYQAYLDDITHKLNNQSLASFTPDINLLDALVRSITIR